MQKLLCLALLAACELRPAPEQRPAEVVQLPTPGADNAAAGATDAGLARPDITAECMQVAAQVAQVFIDSATDPAQRAVVEQARTTMTRKMGEACTSQGWSEPARRCFLAAKAPADIKACEVKFQPAPPPAAPEPTGPEPT